MEPQPANAFKLSLEGGNLVCELGNVLPPDAGSGVTVTDRVIFSPDVGRRLVCWLGDCLQSQAAALRAAEGKLLTPAEAAVAVRAGQAPGRSGSAAGERAAQLLRLVGELGTPYQYERSFRMCRRALLANRFLLTVDVKNISGDPKERILQICDRLAIPHTSRQAVETNLATAKCVHFGFETDDTSIICKVYLERDVSAEESAAARAHGEPALLHLALKWDLISDSAVTTRYWWHPFLSASEVEARLVQVYREGPATSLDIARSALALTVGRVETERLQYLEVEEPENNRRSFDLNLYNAKLLLKDAQPLLQRMREHFGVRPGQLQALYDQIKTTPLGHLAGGVHRNGEDFFNVYYGVVGMPHFHRQFR